MGKEDAEECNKRTEVPTRTCKGVGGELEKIREGMEILRSIHEIILTSQRYESFLKIGGKVSR